MIRDFSNFSTSNSTSAPSAGQQTVFIFIMSSSGHTVETMYARTWRCSASSTMTGITSVQGTYASG